MSEKALPEFKKIELEKAAVDEGFPLQLEYDGLWLEFGRLKDNTRIRLSYQEGGYIIAVNHLGVSNDLLTRWSSWPGIVPIGFTGLRVFNTDSLHQIVREVWNLASEISNKSTNDPLSHFESCIKDLPRSTEAERLVVQRIGQNLFRDSLLSYWGGQCAVSGLSETQLLRASHIKPWSECETDSERLDVFNGFLLAVHLDAAFDTFLISFTNEGGILFSNKFNREDREILGIHNNLRLKKISSSHLPYLIWHRQQIEKQI